MPNFDDLKNIRYLIKTTHFFCAVLFLLPDNLKISKAHNFKKNIQTLMFIFFCVRYYRRPPFLPHHPTCRAGCCSSRLSSGSGRMLRRHGRRDRTRALQGHRWWWWNDVLQDIGGRSITGSCARLEPESCRFEDKWKRWHFSTPNKKKRGWN